MPNKAVNSDVFFVRCAHYKHAGYGWRYASKGKRMRLRIIGLVLLLVIFQPVNASFSSQEELGKWFTYFYLNPEPQRVPEALEYMSNNGWLDKKNSISPFFGFLSGIFSKYPNEVPTWINSLHLESESHYGVVVLGLWYSSLPDSQQRTYDLIEKHSNLKPQFSYLYNGSPMAITDIPLEQGTWVLDALWGNFMATGNPAPVVRIITTLPWLDVKGDINKLSIGGAARWSLTSNAVQHRKVLEVCESEVKLQATNVANKLTEVLEAAKNEAN